MKSYILEKLTQTGVTVLTIRTFDIDGETVTLQPHAASFDNTLDGRERLIETLPEPYLSAVLSVWGDDVIPYEVAEEGDAE